MKADFFNIYVVNNYRYYFKYVEDIQPTYPL